MTATSEHFEQEFLTGNDGFETLRLCTEEAAKTKVIACQPQRMLDNLQHPDDDVRVALAPLTRKTTLQFVDSEWSSLDVVPQHIEIHPVDKDARVPALKKEVFQAFFISTTMTLGIDVSHAETVDKAAGSVQDAMRDLPIKIHYGVIQ